MKPYGFWIEGRPSAVGQCLLKFGGIYRAISVFVNAGEELMQEISIWHSVLLWPIVIVVRHLTVFKRFALKFSF